MSFSIEALNLNAEERILLDLEIRIDVLASLLLKRG